MRRKPGYLPRILLTAGAVLLIAGCSLFPWQSSRYGGDTSEVFFLNVGRDSAREISYTLRLGSDIADVYFAFVNYGVSSTNVPLVVSSSVVPPQGSGEEDGTGSVVVPRAGRSVGASGTILDRRVEPNVISAFNGNPPEMIPGPAGNSSRSAAGSRSLVPRADLEGDTITFYQYNGDFSTPVQTPATLRRVVSDGNGMTVNVWVEDALFGPNGTPDLVTPEKVDALANTFLAPGEHNDIYDWVSTVIGAPWGPHGFINLLPPDRADTIDILLVDILRDGATDSGVVGYFWGKDNYLRTANGQATDESNERIMFYLDALMYGQEEGGWDSGNSWPQLVFSTLAHEFQHMIHFYQKTVLRTGSGDSAVWLNEMLSLVTEDLVAFEMDVPGPRGVDPVAVPDGGPGSSGNVDGWLGLFNDNNDIGLYSWDTADPIPNYAISYGFGSFLVRNYGGAAFLRETVQNQFVGQDAVEEALDVVRARVSYREVLSEWAAAVLTSDEEIDPSKWGTLDSVYNTGGWFESSLDGAIYRLGSINLYNHETGESPMPGPRFYSGATIGSESVRPGGSVVYYRAGESLTGTHEWTFSIGANTDVVVVAKQAP